MSKNENPFGMDEDSFAKESESNEITINIKNLNGDTNSIRMKRNALISEVKEQIKKSLDFCPKDDLEHGFRFYIFLSFQGKKLDDNKTLNDYEIENDDFLHFLTKNIHFLYVETLAGEKVEISGFCICCCNIDYLKGLIEEKLKIPKEDQFLVFNGKLAKDNQQIGYPTYDDFEKNSAFEGCVGMHWGDTIKLVSKEEASKYK